MNVFLGIGLTQEAQWSVQGDLISMGLQVISVIVKLRKKRIAHALSNFESPIQ